MKRRNFLYGAAGAAGSFTMSGVKPPDWRPLQRRKIVMETQGTARNLIFMFLSGGPSQVDTFDLKPGYWTPDLMGVESVGDGSYWPAGTLPKLNRLRDKFTILRAVSAVEAVHERAVYHATTAHRESPSQLAEVPLFGSVMSYMLHDQRKPEDILPTFIRTGTADAKNGFLPVEHLGLSLNGSARLEDVDHPYAGASERFQLLDRMFESMDEMSGQRQQRAVLQKKARNLMTEEVKTLINGPQGGPSDFARGEAFLRQAETAVRVIAADRGTRVFMTQLGGWDNHSTIYDPLFLPAMSRLLDESLAYMIEKLDSLPASGGGPGTLLDQTLIVAMGEFGRTVGPLNLSQGRDHFPYAMSVFMAGGGVQPGRRIGATDERGGVIIDPGWSHLRFMGINDVWASIYSALGIDWTQRFWDTPSGRPFEIVDSTIYGQSFAIDALFE